jgi:hypothetical protein
MLAEHRPTSNLAADRGGSGAVGEGIIERHASPDRSETAVTDPSGLDDTEVPEADRQEQVTDADGTIDPDLTTLRRGRSSDDEVPEADALEQATALVDDEEAGRW